MEDWLEAFMWFILISLVIVGCIATPAAIIYGIYQWAVMDIAFKLALWGGIKVWVSMIGLGVFGAVVAKILK